MEYETEIRAQLVEYRRQALTAFVEELVEVILKKEGFTFCDLIGAITDYSFYHPEFRNVTSLLEQVQNAIDCSPVPGAGIRTDL